MRVVKRPALGEFTRGMMALKRGLGATIVIS
jgi:hypothetical protein